MRRTKRNPLSDGPNTPRNRRRIQLLSARRGIRQSGAGQLAHWTRARVPLVAEEMSPRIRPKIKAAWALHVMSIHRAATKKAIQTWMKTLPPIPAGHEGHPEWKERARVRESVLHAIEENLRSDEDMGLGRATSMALLDVKYHGRNLSAKMISTIYEAYNSIWTRHSREWLGTKPMIQAIRRIGKSVTPKNN